MANTDATSRNVGSGKSAHEVIDPPNKLKDKVKPIRQEHGKPIEDPVARAERELKKLEPQFEEWMAKDIARLQKAWVDLNEEAGVECLADPEIAAPLFRAAHDLKGQAATFGSPYVATVAASLCMIFEDDETLANSPPVLIEQHINAIAAMHREGDESGSDSLASKLCEELTKITQSIVAATKAQQLKAS